MCFVYSSINKFVWLLLYSSPSTRISKTCSEPTSYINSLFKKLINISSWRNLTNKVRKVVKTFHTCLLIGDNTIWRSSFVFVNYNFHRYWYAAPNHNSSWFGVSPQNIIISSHIVKIYDNISSTTKTRKECIAFLYLISYIFWQCVKIYLLQRYTKSSRIIIWG